MRNRIEKAKERMHNRWPDRDEMETKAMCEAFKGKTPDQIRENFEKATLERIQNETRKLLGNIMAHPELHDLITHLDDFQEAVEYYTSELDRGTYVSEEEYESTLEYWNHQQKVLNRLLAITKYC